MLKPTETSKKNQVSGKQKCKTFKFLEKIAKNFKFLEKIANFWNELQKSQGFG